MAYIGSTLPRRIFRAIYQPGRSNALTWCPAGLRQLSGRLTTRNQRNRKRTSGPERAPAKKGAKERSQVLQSIETPESIKPPQREKAEGRANQKTNPKAPAHRKTARSLRTTANRSPKRRAALLRVNLPTIATVVPRAPVAPKAQARRAATYQSAKDLKAPKNHQKIKRTLSLVGARLRIFLM